MDSNAEGGIMRNLVFLAVSIFTAPALSHGEFVICGERGVQYGPSIGFDGTNFLVTWTDGRDSLEQIYAARVNTSGTVLDPGGFPVKTENDEQISSDIAFDGTNYLVVWQFGC
jgi:hypothetical protein